MCVYTVYLDTLIQTLIQTFQTWYKSLVDTKFWFGNQCLGCVLRCVEKKNVLYVYIL